jgi:hypothetical protein
MSALLNFSIVESLLIVVTLLTMSTCRPFSQCRHFNHVEFLYQCQHNRHGKQGCGYHQVLDHVVNLSSRASHWSLFSNSYI